MSTNFIKDYEANQDPEELCRTLRKLGYTPFTAMLEFIDNSVSAGARRVDIFRKDNFLIVRDNGTGIKEVDYNRLSKIFTGGKARTSLLGKNGAGFKAASLYMAKRVTVVTKLPGKEAVVLTPLFNREKVRAEHPTAENKVEMDEARNLPRSGTSVILNLNLFKEETEKLLCDLKNRLGFYYCFLMESRKGWKGVDIRVENEMVVPFDPSCPDFISGRASGKDAFKVIELSRRKKISLVDGNNSIDAEVFPVHLPDKKFLNKKDREMAERIYPKFLMDDKISSGIYIVRYNRIQGVLSFDDVGLKGGGHLNSCRILLFLESNSADRAFFDAHVNKAIREDLSEDLKRSIRKEVREFTTESKTMRDTAIQKRKITNDDPKLSIKKMCKWVTSICKKAARKSLNAVMTSDFIKKEVLKRMKVAM